jgi:hypothetical protein
MMGKPDAFSGKFIQVGGLKVGLSKTPQVAVTQVIGEDINDIRFRVLVGFFL